MDSDDLQKLLGSNINRYRQIRSLTIEKLADEAGMSTGHVNDVIHGRKWVSATFLAKMSVVLEVPVADLFAIPGESRASDPALMFDLGEALKARIGAAVQVTVSEYLDKASR